MDKELFEPTMKTSSDALVGTIDNPAHLVPAEKSQAASFPLDRSIIILGNDDAADIRIEEKSVAPYHAEISFSEGVYRIRHLDGRAAVTVNGREVNDSVLKHGDSVAIADCAFTFEYAARSDATEQG